MLHVSFDFIFPASRFYINQVLPKEKKPKKTHKVSFYIFFVLLLATTYFTVKRASSTIPWSHSVKFRKLFNSWDEANSNVPIWFPCVPGNAVSKCGLWHLTFFFALKNYSEVTGSKYRCWSISARLMNDVTQYNISFINRYPNIPNKSTQITPQISDGADQISELG